ncbi:MAG TPA: hypothetical protein VIH17_03275 [Candidatus Acidoferrales bacterium]
MWRVGQEFEEKVLEQLSAAGFACEPESGEPGRVRVTKYHCGAVLKADGKKVRLVELPGYILRRELVRLWDAGFQKFFLSGDGKRIPALAEHLRHLQKFNEELGAVLGLPTYYNEALGSVCDVSAYDRVQGRK